MYRQKGLAACPTFPTTKRGMIYGMEFTFVNRNSYYMHAGPTLKRIKPSLEAQVKKKKKNTLYKKGP
jgi:hypothetical protein